MNARESFARHFAAFEPEPKTPDFGAQALAHLAAQEAAAYYKEQNRIAQQRHQEDQAQAEQMTQAEQDAVKRLKDLAPLYTQRAELAKSLLIQLADFYKLNSKLIDADFHARDVVQAAWNGRVSPFYHAERWQDLRLQAGLKPNHEQLGLNADTDVELAAAVVLRLLALGAVQPGVVHVGQRSTSFDFSRGL